MLLFLQLPEKLIDWDGNLNPFHINHLRDINPGF